MYQCTYDAWFKLPDGIALQKPGQKKAVTTIWMVSLRFKFALCKEMPTVSSDNNRH